MEVFKNAIQSGYSQKQVFENAVDHCERTKTDKNKNVTTAKTKYFTHFSPNSSLNLKNAKVYKMEYIKFASFPNQTVSNNQF